VHVGTVIKVVLLLKNRCSCKAVFVVILSGHHFAGELQELLLDGIGLLSHFQEGNGEVILV
jgi:hypothetical protein